MDGQNGAPPEQNAPEERLKNLQAEMNRKTSNLDSKLEQINP